MSEMTLQECIARLEDLIQDRKSFFSKDGNDDVFRTDAAALKRAISELRKIASGEYRSVVHGRWEKDCDTIKCPVCGFGTFRTGYFFMNGVCFSANGKFIPKYCPYCGALMDGEDSNNHA